MSSGFKKALFVIFVLLFFFVLLPVIFFFVTFPLVPKYFATQDLKDYILDFERRAIELSEEEVPNCKHFVEERDSWRLDYDFLANYGDAEQIEALFERSWEDERKCLYSMVNKPNAFVSTYRLKLLRIDTDVTDFKNDVDSIISSFDRESTYYYKYKRTVDEDMAARKEFYKCRDTVSENFEFSQFYDSVTNEYLGSEGVDFTPLAEGFEECGVEFEKKLREFDLEYEEFWENLFKERERRYKMFQKLKEEMELE